MPVHGGTPQPGTILEEWQSGTTYYAIIKWTTQGTATLKFKNGSVIKASKSITIAPMPPPSTPVATVGTNITSTSFSANWNGSTSATSYRLDVSMNSSFSPMVTGYNNLTVSATTKSVTGLTPGTTYYYRVRAVNSSGTSGNSAVINVILIPATPVTTSGASITPTSFTANWLNASGAANYRLDVSTSSLFSSFITGYNNLTVSGTSQNVTGLFANTTYYYRVRAVNTSGTTVNSNTTTIVTAPAAPVATASSNITSNSFRANWNASAGASDYRLDVSANSAFSTFILNDLPVTGTNWNVTGLTDKVTYYYRVRAVNSSGTSVNSNFILAVNLDQNYIKTTNVNIEGITTQAQIANAALGETLIQYGFFDGFGRPIQSVLKQQSPDQRDIVQPVVYDAFGRETVKYLPYVSGNDGWYKPDFIPLENANYESLNSPQFQFYQNTPKVTSDTKPYAVTILEPSPLNRVIKQGAPGTAWQPDAVNTYSSTDHSIKKSYEFNTVEDKVLLWTYAYPTTENPFGMVNAGNGITPVYYPPNQLYKNRTKDENGNEVIEYFDKEGKAILKRVQAVGGSPAITDSTYASTYFVYNHFGKEVCVIPPEAVKRINKTSSEYFGKTDVQKNDFLKRWAYRYTYDGRLRQTQKQIPGAEPVYMVYNDRDLLVMSQDGNQRTQNKWLFTKYDALNRPVIIGVYTHNTSVDQAGMSALIDTTNFFESYNAIVSTHRYSNTVFPITNADSSPLQILTVTYYDNYQFRDDLAGSSYNYFAGDLTNQATAFNRVTGLVTGTKVNVLNTSDYLWSVNYYDDKYRTIQTFAQNHKGGIDRITNKLDFVGNVLESKTTHTIGTVTHTITRRTEYDHGQRPLKIWHKVNDKPEVLLSTVEYNALSEPVVKKLHSDNNGVSFKQHLDYRYNIRGWLTRINNSDLIPDDVAEPKDLFGMNLAYNDIISGVNNTPQFNGNISATKYSTNQGFDPGLTERAYKYQYDAMSRLTAATHFEKSGAWNSSTALHEDNITYDLNTSILTMSRKGEDGSQMDNLVFDYGTGGTSGNQLLKVTDSWNKGKGFVDGANTDNDYSYDTNGNRLIDKNRNITTAITYNYMNLAEKIVMPSGSYLFNVYDASGTKLSQGVYNSSNVLQKKTDYVGEFLYENDTLKYFSHEEGRYNMLASAYEYALRDHLANNRVTFTTKQEQDAATATLETANLTAEQAKFLRYENARRISSHLFDKTNGSAPSTTPGYAVRLNGSANEKMGLARSFAVVPGDTVKAEVYVKYIDTNSSNWTSALNTLLSQIASGTAPAGTVVDGGSYSSSTSSFPFTGLLNTSGSTGTGPKAYLNWLVFDKNFMLINGGYVRMSNAAREYGQDCAHEKLTAEFTITEPGFVYVYLSNENETLVEVYYDQFSISLHKSPVTNITDLYPYGAPSLSYTREFSLKQDKLMNGKEWVDELNYNKFNLGQREFDPFVPMFSTQDRFAEKYYWMSPYQYAAGNPVKFVDVNGDSLKVTFLDKKGNPINTIPSAVQQMFNSEYGIKVGYNAKTSMLYYEGEIETEKTVSESAKETIVGALQDETTGKKAAKKYGEIIFGQGNFGVYGPATSDWHAGAAQVGRRAWIDLADFRPDGSISGFDYSNLDKTGVSRRAFNFGRVFEHEWIGHVLNKKRDPLFPGLPGGTVLLGNKFSREMGLPERLNYGGVRMGVYFGNRSDFKQMRKASKRGLIVPFIPSGFN